MEVFLIIIGVIAVGYIVVTIMEAIYEANKNKNSRITSHKNNLDEQRNNLKNLESNIKGTIREFFAVTPGFYYNTNSSTYNSTYIALKKIISGMETTIAQMKDINGKLVKESRREDQSEAILQEESCVISRAQKCVDGFDRFGKKVYTISTSKMMDENSYGKVNKPYWDSVCYMQRSDTVDYISKCEYLLGSNQYDELFAIDIEKVMNCVWFFATEKTFSASDFQKAESVFARIYKYCHADLIIAGLYAKKKMGGEDVLRDPVRYLLKQQEDSHILTLVASGLMWMNAYKSETAVLQHMLTYGMEMAAKTQERLHSLTNGGGKAPNGFDVQSSASLLYFDVSALAWKDDEYIGLFENLAFQDKTLLYSLAVRDENKDMFIPQDISVPDMNIVLNKFKSLFSEEYGSGVVVKVVNCIALSGSGEEKIEGILVSANECKYMGVLIYIARIGKKLIIKFYTLFMPTSDDLSVQKQQALSMYKKLGPSVTMWESSLKDTMLMAVEQLLNANVQAYDHNSEDGISVVDPIF